MLERWLEEVRAGRVFSVAIAAVLDDNALATEWQGPKWGALLGAVACLQQRMAA